MVKKIIAIILLLVMFVTIQPSIFVESANAASLPASYSLSMTRYAQGNSDWCWVATAKMIGKYFGYTHSQTSIVNHVKEYVL